MSVFFRISITVFILYLVGCSQEPSKIHYGSDECAYCKMMITNDRFATQLVTDKGRSYFFDSIECMAAYQKEHKRKLQQAKLWVNNYNSPGQWLDAGQAQYVKSKVVQSPMGESLLAFPSATEAEKYTADNSGRLMQWKEVKQLKMEMNR